MKETNKNSKFAFTKNNYILLGVGVLFIIIGFFLMQGGGSEDPNNFNEDIFGFRRTRRWTEARPSSTTKIVGPQTTER